MKKILAGILVLVFFCACAKNSAQYNELFSGDMQPINNEAQKEIIIKSLQE